MNAKTAETDHWKTSFQRTLLFVRNPGYVCRKMQISFNYACVENFTINGIEYEVTWSNLGVERLTVTGPTKKIISLVFAPNTASLDICILRSPTAHGLRHDR